MTYQEQGKRNWAVYILFFMALAAALLAFVDAARYMGWIPVNVTLPGLGEISFLYPGASWIPALLSAFLGALWLLVAYWLWTLNPSGWMFVIIISVINLIFMALAVLGRTTFSQVLPALLVNGLAFILALLPSTQKAFMPRRALPEKGQAEGAAAAAAAAYEMPDFPAVEIKAMDEAEIEAAVVAAETDAPPVELPVPAPIISPRAGAALSEATPQPEELTLTVVEGIGPKIAAALEAAGINSIYKLAAVSEEELRNLLRDAGLSADPTTWPKQAQLAASGDLAALKAYQERLVGGREV